MADWPRDAFVRAVWESDLPHVQKLVALAYADHAGSDDFAFVTYDRMQVRASLSRGAISRATAALVAAGWLAQKEPARQHRSARYYLRDPGQQSPSGTAGSDQESSSVTAESPSGHAPELLTRSSSLPPDASSLPPDASSLPGGPDQSPHHSDDSTSDDADGSRRADVVAVLLAEHAPALTEEQILGALDSMEAWARRKNDPIRDLAAFTAPLSLEQLQRWAGVPVTTKSTSKPLGPGRRRCLRTQTLIAADNSCCAECATAERESEAS